MSQAEVNQSIIGTLEAINETAKSQANYLVGIVDKMVVQADLMLAISERLEVSVDLITTHVDNHDDKLPSLVHPCDWQHPTSGRRCGLAGGHSGEHEQ